MTFLINQVGRGLSTLPSKKRISAGHTTQRLATSLGLKFLGHMNKPFALTKEIVIPYGEMLQYWSSPRLMTMSHPLTKVITPKSKAPVGYKKILVHLIYDVKHNGRHKAILLADGHLTDIPLESVYSVVVSLWRFRVVLFLAELNTLKP
jgi:hypothetical protein